MSEPKINPLYELIKYLTYFEELGYPWLPRYREFSFIFNRENFGLKKGDLEDLFNQISRCQSCFLHRIRKQPVFEKRGSPIDLMLIGDFPSKEDDFYGVPFSGPLGETLQKMLLSIGLKREDFYVTLVVKCKPPAGRLPEEEEIQACKKYLLQEIMLLKPRLILALGNLPVKVFLEKPVTLSSLRSKPFKYKNSMIIFTYHPSYMLKNPQVKRFIWEDLKTFRKLYDETF